MGGQLSNQRVPNSIKLLNQTVDSAVTGFPTPVYFDVDSGEWKATPASSPNVIALATDATTVQFAGEIEGTFVAGSQYYISSSASGELDTSSTSNTKVGYAISSTKLLINIDGSLYQGVTITAFALFGGGQKDGDTKLSTTEKYQYDNNSVSFGTNLSEAKASASFANSSTVGYIFAGSSSSIQYTNKTEKYGFANDSVSTLANLTFSHFGSAAAGNSEKALINGGNDGDSTRDDSNKYQYSNDALTSITSLVESRFSHTAVGNSTVGIFCAGAPLYKSTTEKYTYSTDARTNGTALSFGRQQMWSFGNTVFGIIAGGYSDGATKLDSTEKYTYSNDSRASGTSLGTARNNSRGTSCSEYGIFGGGATSGSNTNYVGKYIFSGETVSAGTSLVNPMVSCSANSSSPGYL